MRWLLSLVFLLSTVAGPPIVMADGGGDDPTAPTFVAPDEGAPAPSPPPSGEQPCPEDEAPAAGPSLLDTANAAGVRRPRATDIPASADLSVPRPPPTR